MTAESAPVLPVSADRPRLLTVRLSIMMFLQWAMYGFWVPQLGKFLKASTANGGLGFDDLKLGLIFGLSGSIGALLAPFVGGQVADRYVRTERVMAVLLVIGGALQWVLSYQTTFAAWLCLSIASAIAYGPTGALSNSLAFSHMTDPRREFPIVRVWGTIGWIVPAWVFPMVWLQTDLVLGWKPPFLTGQELPNVTARLVDSFQAAGTLAFFYALYCLTLPPTRPNRDAREPLAFRKAFNLCRHRSFAVLLVVALLIAAIHQIYFIQTSPFLSHLGMRDSDIMPAMSIGQFFEIFMIAILGLLLKRLGFRAVMTIGALGYFMRFAAYGTTSLPLYMIVAAQAFHGICFACFYAAAFIYIDRLADEDVRHSAQTTFGILLGVGPVLGGLLNGALGRWFNLSGARPNYMGFWYVLAGIGLVATIILGLLFRDEASTKTKNRPEPAAK